MKIVSVNLARVGSLFVRDEGAMHRIATGIHKQPVSGLVRVTRLGLEGDEQADRRLHGGPGKAVYAYPVEHYPFWNAQRERVRLPEALHYGDMGENLSLEGLPETEVFIGDRIEAGSAMLEVTEPRTPCFKFCAKIGLRHGAKLMMQTGFSGFYLRVLREGSLQAGDAVRVLPGVRELSVATFNDRRRTAHQSDLF